jgi:hypothetical protein
MVPAADVIGDILGLEAQFRCLNLILALLVLHVGVLAPLLAKALVSTLHFGLQAAPLFLQAIEAGLLFVQFTLQTSSLAAQDFGLLRDGFDSILRPGFFLLALTGRFFELFDAAEHRRALSLQTLFELTCCGKLDAQLVELLGRSFLLTRLALRLFHGLGRLVVSFLDLPAAFRNAAGQFLRSFLGGFVLLRGAFLLTLQTGGPVFGFLQFFLQQPVVGSQGSQFVLLAPNVDSSRLESLSLCVATGQNAEADLLVSRELCLDQSELLPERNDFVAALQGGGRPLARATAGNNTRGINQFPVLRGKGGRRMTRTQLGGVIEIGRERDSVQNASQETVQIVALAADTVGGPAERAVGCRSGCGKMVAVGRHHAGASQFVLVK